MDDGFIAQKIWKWQGKATEYWVAGALAQYRWATAKRFKDIFDRVALSTIIAMYPTFHEMDISRFIESMDRRYDESVSDTKLKKIRESRKISQSRLSTLSGVNLRSIQLYEQHVADIDKAQAQTLYKLSLVLGCDIEDLFKKPESI